MRWRQVVGLYAVVAVLGVEYWVIERRTEPPAPEHPVRQRFLTVEPEKVLEIRLTRGARTVVSVRRDGRWQVIEPADAAVPPDLIAAFANALAGAEEIEVMAGEGDARAFGLDGPAGRVELVVAGGAPLVVTLGGTNPTGTAVYARRGSAPGIVLIGLNVRYYEDLIFQALPTPRAPAVDQGQPVGG